jgi:Sel1 repeat-containing protein
MILDDRASGWAGDASLANTRRWMAEHGHDPEFVESINLEIEQQVLRGDVELGILPIKVVGEMAAGFAAAALAGRAESWLALGRCYRNGWIQQPITWPGRHEFADTELVGAALRCFAEAAALGDRTGAISFAAVSRYASPEARRAALACLSGFLDDDPDGTATYWYGLVEYFQGETTSAAATQERSAALGNADAMFELYVLHAKGDGVPQDDEAARTWLLRAADLDQPRALYNVAAGHATGDGFPKDGAVAAGYYERAAKAGNERAAATLGVMYLTGDGVPEDPATAARWFDSAESADFDVDGWLDQLGLSRPTIGDK